MGFLDFLKPVNDSIDINEAVERLHAEEGAVLLDVREPGEYVMGHIPGAVNLPLSRIQYVEEKAPNMAKPVFVYCMSGMRSRRAARFLRSMGFREVKNAGAIGGYRGELEQGQ
jgi:rhodanese-related sulfurtransferase